MAFPTIPTVAGGRLLTTVQANTTATRTFPNLSSLTKNAGDLLIAIVVGYQSSLTSGIFGTWGAGFTEIRDIGVASQHCVGVAYKISDGTETGTFTVTQAGTVTGHAAMILMSIPGAHASTAPEVSAALATGTAAAANPAALDPAGWAAEDTLWIAVGASGETSTTGSYTGIASAPANYTDYADTGISGDVVGGVEAAVAFRQLNGASEDVGTFSVDTSNARNAALVIAVRPVTIEVHEGTWSTTGGGTVVSSGQKNGAGAAAITGGGTVVSSATTERAAATALTGSGTVAFNPTTERNGTYAATGGGTVVIVGEVGAEEHEGTWIATGGGAVTFAGTTERASQVPLTGGGTVAFAGTTERGSQAVLSGGGTVAFEASTERASALVLTGGGTVETEATAERSSAWTATGAGTVEIDQTTSRNGTVVVTGGGTVQFNGAVGGGEEHEGTWSVTGGGTVEIDGTTERSAVLPLTGAGTVALAATTIREGIWIITGGGTVVINGIVPGAELPDDLRADITDPGSAHGTVSLGTAFRARITDSGGIEAEVTE